MEIQDLLKIYAAHPQIIASESLLKDSTVKNIFLKGLNGSAAAMVLASFFTRQKGHFVCILSNAEEAGYFYHDLMQVTNGEDIFFFPSSYRRSIKYGHTDSANEILRTEVLSQISPSPPQSPQRGDSNFSLSGGD